LDRLFSKVSMDALSPTGLAWAALTYTLHANPSNKLSPKVHMRLKGVYTRLLRLVRVQGRSAYVAGSIGSQHSAGLEANAIVLLALARAGGEALRTDFASASAASIPAKLAAYVANGGNDWQSAMFGGGCYVSARSTALASVALAAYDLAQGSTRPDVEMTARSGSFEVLEFEAKGGAPPPTAVSVPWESLSRPPEPLRFEAKGRGQVSITASLNFVPASVPTEGAIYRGIFVEKVVRKMDPNTGKATGPALQVVRLGESVVVTIQVTTPDDIARVMLEDPAAGGLEPVDPKVAGDEAGENLGSDGNCKFGWSWWCAPSFANRETYADRVTWTSWETLPAGTHTLSYQATAATRGIFVLPPAHAYVENQPELMGLSQAGTIVVAGGGTCGTDKGGLGALDVPDGSDSNGIMTFLRKINVHPRTSAIAKGCPGGCPNGGVCQLETGTCGCYQGMSFVEGDCPKSGEATESFEKLFASGSAASVGEGVVVRAGFLPNIATVLTASACITVALVLFAFRIQKSARPHFKQYLLLHNFRQPYSMQSEFVMDVGGPCLIRTAEEGNPSSPFSGCE